jgi:hypothetical protein
MMRQTFRFTLLTSVDVKKVTKMGSMDAVLSSMPLARWGKLYISSLMVNA